MPINERKIKFKGFMLPVGVVEQIIKAQNIWRDRDNKSWEFAEQAYSIVGLYIPDATQALALAMGVSSVDKPEGYAKAWQLRGWLERIEHQAPLPNLYISHYIAVGKSVSAKMRPLVVSGDVEGQDNLIFWADGILQEASRGDWTVEQLRKKIHQQGMPADDSFVNSANIIIPMIEQHIINASYYGVNEIRASVAARIGRIFIAALKWATGSNQETPPRETQNRVENILTASERLFRDGKKSS